MTTAAVHVIGAVDVAEPPDRRAADSAVARRRAEDALRAADVSALKGAFYMRLFALAAIAIWLTLLLSFPTVLFFWALLLGFIVLGYAQYRAGHKGESALLYALILADALLMAFTLVTDNPLADADFPPGQKLQQSREVYFFILLAGVAACYQPRRVLWAGFCAMAAWSLAFLWVASDPDAISVLDVGDAPNLESWIVMTNNPNFIVFERLIQSVVVIGIVAAILATVAARARSMVRSQIAAARERANLARYFAPALVDTLSQKDAAFDAIQAQPAAVLFADVVGFTAMSEGEPPERVIGFLRALHERLEQSIFDNGGTLDKYMGDGVMAIFGAPTSAPDDACRAIAAARAIQDAMTAWNDARSQAGFPPVHVAVGVHYGAVVSGDIGSERRLEFATIGDAVNLASRLETATRRVGASVLVSAETAEQARREDGRRAETLLADFVAAPALDLPGHRAIDAFALMR